MAATISHTSLGEIRGKVGDGVVQYLGLKYATLKNRFAEPEVVTAATGPSSQGPIDATTLGPSAVSNPQGIDFEFAFIQQTLPHPPLPQSDIDCLNLNITVPANTAPDAKLPVFVFVHGGGFIIGSNAWPQADQAKLVALSAELGTPVIGVGINYRLHALGFLTSEELRAAGIKANRGLRDQRAAMTWVQQHISGFGGDASNVTIVGQSAGAASATLMLHSETPLFKRLAGLGGSCLLVKPVPEIVYEGIYGSVIEALGLKDLSAEERVKKLLEMPSDEVVAKIPPQIPFMAVLDGDIIPKPITFAEVMDKSNGIPYGKKWCSEVFMQDCQTDASIFTPVFGARKAGIAKSFATSIRSSLGSADAAALLKEYNLSDDTPDDDAFLSIIRWASDIGFLAPAIAFAKGWPGKSYLSHFNEPNPWNGQWKGYATHILEVAFLFQNFNDQMAPEQVAVAKDFAKDLITFVNGGAPWQSLSKKEVSKVYDSRGGGLVDHVYGVEGRDFVFKTASLDAFSSALSNFLAGQ